MKMWMYAIMGWALLGFSVQAAPLRVALLDFEDETGQSSDALLGGAIAPGSLAAKGALVLGKQLAPDPAFNLIDRRDFTTAIASQDLTDAGQPTTAKPSVLHAAQALRADAIIRGSILSFSAGKQLVNQGGHRADLSTLTLRVSLEAQDVIDGSVIALSDGAAQFTVRQTDMLQTVLSEDEVLGLLDQAVGEAYAEVRDSLESWQVARAERPKVQLFVKTDADPALVEIDGILVGSSPLEGYAVYKGDHVIRIGKPGYYDMTKRILFEQDTSIEVPMLKVQLSADEMAEVLKTIRLSVFAGEPGFIINAIHTTQ